MTPPSPEFRYFTSDCNKAYWYRVNVANEVQHAKIGTNDWHWHGADDAKEFIGELAEEHIHEVGENGQPLVERAGEAIEARGQCMRCHEQATLVAHGALCQPCVDSLATPPPVQGRAWEVAIHRKDGRAHILRPFDCPSSDEWEIIRVHEVIETTVRESGDGWSKSGEALLARFKYMSSCRRKVADQWREKGEFHVASQSDASADIFDRCASELEQTLAGETPPEPGAEWPQPLPAPPSL